MPGPQTDGTVGEIAVRRGWSQYMTDALSSLGLTSTGLPPEAWISMSPIRSLGRAEGGVGLPLDCSRSEPVWGGCVVSGYTVNNYDSVFCFKIFFK